MRIRHRGHDPSVDPSAFVAPTAVLVGRVSVGPGARILYGAVLDAEEFRIDVGACAIVSENAVIRATEGAGDGHPVTIGDHVLIGPHATLLGCAIEPFAYISTGASILQGSVVQSGCVVGIGAIVHADSVVPRGLFIPPNTIAIGDPADIYSPDEKVTLASYIKMLRFGGIAPGSDSPEDRISMLKRATEGRSRQYEAHKGDAVIDKTPK